MSDWQDISTAPKDRRGYFVGARHFIRLPIWMALALTGLLLMHWSGWNSHWSFVVGYSTAVLCCVVDDFLYAVLSA